MRGCFGCELGHSQVYQNVLIGNHEVQGRSSRHSKQVVLTSQVLLRIWDQNIYLININILKSKEKW